MSQSSHEPGSRSGDAVQDTVEGQRQEIADVDAALDADSDGDGLAAEAGRSEETGIAEG